MTRIRSGAFRDRDETIHGDRQHPRGQDISPTPSSFKPGRNAVHKLAGARKA